MRPPERLIEITPYITGIKKAEVQFSPNTLLIMQLTRQLFIEF